MSSSSSLPTRLPNLANLTNLTLTPTTVITAAAVSLATMSLFSSLFRSKNHLPVNGRLFVITGGSQGMGLCVAKELARKGASVVIIARDMGKLEKALGEIKAQAAELDSQSFRWISADLTEPREVKSAFEEVVETLGVPDVVWICAGSSHPGLMTETTPEILDFQMKANYMSALYTAHTAINLFNSHPLPANTPSTHKRHIIFTSSVLAFLPIVGYASYSPAKAALRSLADTLRQECLMYDITISCIFPATIFTPGYDFEQTVKPAVTKKLEEKDDGQSPEEVAKICISKLERGQQMITTVLLGSAMKATSWGGSKRNNIVIDTIWIWIVSVVVLVIGWDLDRTVRKWGRENTFPGKPAVRD